MFFRRRRPIIWVFRKKVPKFLIACGVVGVILIILFFIVEKNLRPTIMAIAEAKSKQIAIESINSVIRDKIVADVEYQDLIKIHKDNNSKVVLIQTNIIKIDKLQAEAVTEINHELKNLPREKMYIPLGQVLGSQLLAAYGPKIKVNILPIGTVKVERIDRFEEAGINQTRHMLYFRVESNVKVVVPLESSNVKLASEVLIADNIILGEVPKQYTKINLSEDKLKNLFGIKK